jgi:hypothetical protein
MGDLSRCLLNQSKDLEVTHKRACEASGRVAELEGELQILTDQVELMEDQLCHCRQEEYQPLAEGEQDDSQDQESLWSQASYYLPPTTASTCDSQALPVPPPVNIPVPIEEGNHEGRREHEVRTMSSALVRSAQRCCKTVTSARTNYHPYHLSSAIPRGRYDRHLGVEKRLRRGTRRAQRGLSGYESSSESGSSGLSDDTNYPAHFKSSGMGDTLETGGGRRVKGALETRDVGSSKSVGW